MKRLSAETAGFWLTWIGAGLLVSAALIVCAAIVFTRGIDELERIAMISGFLALPGLLSVVVGRLALAPRD